MTVLIEYLKGKLRPALIRRTDRSRGVTRLQVDIAVVLGSSMLFVVLWVFDKDSKTWLITVGVWALVGLVWLVSQAKWLPKIRRWRRIKEGTKPQRKDFRISG